MLVLSRKVGERIQIGDSIDVVVVRTSGGEVRLGITAPHEIPIRRGELEPIADAGTMPPDAACSLQESGSCTAPDEPSLTTL